MPPGSNNKMMNNVIDIEDADKSFELCNFYENFWNKVDSFALPKGVYTLDDLREFG